MLAIKGSPDIGKSVHARPPALARRHMLRARPDVLNRLPPGIGRDLIEVLYGGWLDRSLWENYGNVPAEQQDVGTAGSNTELRVYVQTARWVLDVMRIAGALPRAGTHFRIASAVIGELNGDQTHACMRCKGTGRARGGRARHTCKVCEGRGMLLPSTSSRADACECRRPEFRDNLMGVYLTLLARLRRELARAMAEYVIAEQWIAHKPRVAQSG